MDHLYIENVVWVSTNRITLKRRAGKKENYWWHQQKYFSKNSTLWIFEKSACVKF